MEDAAYTNQLVQLRAEQTAVAAKMAELKAKLEQFTQNEKGSPEYADLTNRLAQSVIEADRIRKMTLNTIRTLQPERLLAVHHRYGTKDRLPVGVQI